MYGCIGVWECAYTFTRMNLCVDARGKHEVSFPRSDTLLSETMSLTGTWGSPARQVSVQGASGNPLSLPPQYWDCQCVPLHLAFPHGFWGLKFRLLCLLDKSLTHLARSPVPEARLTPSLVANKTDKPTPPLVPKVE